MSDREAVLLVEGTASLAEVAARAGAADRIAVDVESNGLFVYRPALCVVQIAWAEGGAMVSAIIDALAVSVAPLAPILGDRGPVKVLHDLSFDAQMLAQAGAPLGRVRDTSVAARLLGRRATGLASLLAEELGVAHDKRLQQHDWGRRPLREAEIAYLSGDVIHLLALADRLDAAAAALDVAEEIAEECAYKLATALGPRRDARPGWVRHKGAALLDPVGRAVLRRLWLAREDAAAREDVPAFKVTSTEVLMELAEKRPASRADLAPIRGAIAGLAARHAGAWLAAIEAGVADGDLPEDERDLLAPKVIPREEIARRRSREAAVSGWRRGEAKRRGVDEQAVLPGHCADDLVDALLQHADDPAALREAIARIPGLGARRLSRYGDALAALAGGPR